MTKPTWPSINFSYYRGFDLRMVLWWRFTVKPIKVNQSTRVLIDFFSPSLLYSLAFDQFFIGRKTIPVRKVSFKTWNTNSHVLVKFSAKKNPQEIAYFWKKSRKTTRAMIAAGAFPSAILHRPSRSTVSPPSTPYPQLPTRIGFPAIKLEAMYDLIKCK